MSSLTSSSTTSIRNISVSTPTNAAFVSAFSCNQQLASYSKAAESFSSNHSSTAVITTTGLSTYTQEEFGFEVTYTGVNITLCDGHPRAASDTFNGTTVTSFSSVYTQTYWDNFTVPSPTCTLDIPACDLLVTQWYSEIYATQSVDPFAQPTWNVECEGSCGSCSIGAYEAQLLYWPVETAPAGIDNYCKNHSTITQTPTASGPNLAYYSGYTLTSPSVYVILSGIDGLALQAEGPCGPSIAKTIISMDPGEVSTARGSDYIPYSMNFADLNHASVNGSYIPLVPWDAYQGMFWCWAYGTGCPVILDNYRPYILNPTGLRDLDPHWSTCELFTGPIFDPPIPLTTAEFLGGPTVTTTSHRPTTTAGASPGNGPTTTGPKTTTAIPDSQPTSGTGSGDPGSGGSNSDPGQSGNGNGSGSGSSGDPSGSSGDPGDGSGSSSGGSSSDPSGGNGGGDDGGSPGGSSSDDSGGSGSGQSGGSGSSGGSAIPIPIGTVGSSTIYVVPTGSSSGNGNGGGSQNNGGSGSSGQSGSDPSSGSGGGVVVVGGHTLTAGGAATTIGGQTISVGPNGVEIASGGGATRTIALPTIAAGSGETITTVPPVLNVGSDSFTASITSIFGTQLPFYVIDGHTLVPGGTITVTGASGSPTTIALPSADAYGGIAVINGHTTTLSADIIAAAGGSEVITIAGKTYTADSEDEFIITDASGNVETIKADGKTETINGTPVVLLPGGETAIIGGKTFSLSTARATGSSSDPTDGSSETGVVASSTAALTTASMTAWYWRVTALILAAYQFW